MAHRHLRPEEREVISQVLAQGATPPAIAKALGRDPITIRRELRRNGLKGQYCAMHAQQAAVRRHAQSRAKCRKLLRPENLAYVHERLRKRWSPGQVAGRSQRESPENPEQRLSVQLL